MILLKNARCIFAAVLLCFALCQAGAEELSVTTRLSYNDKQETTDGSIAVRAKDTLFDVFCFVESADRFSGSLNARGEAAGKASSPRGSVSVLAGNLTKPSALSRLENPAISDYSTALSGISAPAVGAKGAVPSERGSHPDACAAQIVFPKVDMPAGAFLRRVDSLFVEFYANADDERGARLSASLSCNAGGVFKKNLTAQVNAGWYSYKLAHKEETSWFLSSPYFAPDVFSAFLAEAVIRAPVFNKTPPVTLYAALGFPESPFGGFSRWARAELGFPLPLGAAVLTLKGKVFYAEEDFYTPKNALVAARTKAAGNISLGFLTARAAAAHVGTAFGYDTLTEMYKARGGFSLAADGAGFSLAGFFTNWKIVPAGNSFEFAASSDTAAGGSASVSKIFARVKPEISASYKWYPGKEWKGTKTEYSVSLSAVPVSPAKKSASGVSPRDFIPSASLRYDAVSYADSRFTSSISAAASWKFKTKKLSVTAKADALFPLAR